VKYKKWYSLLKKNMISRDSDNIDIPVDIQKEFFSYNSKINNGIINNPSNNIDNFSSQMTNQYRDNLNEGEFGHLQQPRSVTNNKNDETNSPYSFNYNINMEDDLYQYIKNYSPFNYGKYQPIYINTDDDDFSKKDHVPPLVVIEPSLYNEPTVIPIKSLNRPKSNVSLSVASTSGDVHNIIISSSNGNNNNGRGNSNTLLNDHLTIFNTKENEESLKLMSGNSSNEKMKKEMYRPLSKFALQDSQMNNITYSNKPISNDSSTIIVNDISFNSSHDGLDPLINDQTKKDEENNKHNSKNKISNGLTHRRKMIKSNSNSYLYKSDGNNNSEERINLIPKE